MAKVQSRKTVSISAEGMAILDGLATQVGIPKSQIVENLIRRHVGLPAYNPYPWLDKKRWAVLMKNGTPEGQRMLANIKKRWPTARG